MPHGIKVPEADIHGCGNNLWFNMLHLSSISSRFLARYKQRTVMVLKCF